MDAWIPLKTRENDSHSDIVESDHVDIRGPVFDDSLLGKLREAFVPILKQISSGDVINGLRKRELEPYYNMNHKHRGLALIFNHETFNNGLKQRNGTQVDRERLCETFRLLDFDVQVYDDLKICDIIDRLQKVAEMDHSENDCLLVVFLTHGKLKDFNDDDISCNTLLNHDLMSYVYAKDEKYPLQEAWYYFTNEACPTLANKPRMFFINSCQGEIKEKGFKLMRPATSMRRLKAAGRKVIRTANYTFLPKQDFLVVYSSLPAHQSFRHREKGTWFIQSFCDEMAKRKQDEDLMTTLTRTIQTVAYEYEFHQSKQTPCIFSRLTKLIVFPKKTATDCKPMGWTY